MQNAIELRHITKTFGRVVANRDVSLTVRRGEILSLLGENGSGKTTLMNMIAGIYYPDSGEILVDEKPAEIRSPKDAYALGIGMVHQHFKLIDVFTAAENIALVMDRHEKYDLKAIRQKAHAICERYAFDIDLDQKVYEMSVSQKQTLEIIKMLYRGAQILILDEPTAVLTPQETEKLFHVMRNMREDGKSIIIITHKLHEVLEISDRVAILRKGEYVGTVETAGASEASLTEMMVGKKVELNIERPEPVNPHLRLSVHNLSVTNAEGVRVLDNISFEAFSGEIPATVRRNCWKLLPVCSRPIPGQALSITPTTTETPPPSSSSANRPKTFATWAFISPSFLKIGWAWALSVQWA